MISLSTSGSSIIFTFQDNPHYLQNGTIEMPKNSLTLVTDESNMATFKKSASNDIFVSALYSELGMSKSELESWFKENAVGSPTGIDSGTVQTMIDESLSGYVAKESNIVSGYTDVYPYVNKIYNYSDAFADTIYIKANDGYHSSSSNLNIGSITVYTSQYSWSSANIFADISNNVITADTTPISQYITTELVGNEIAITPKEGYYWRNANPIEGFTFYIKNVYSSGQSKNVIEDTVYKVLDDRNEQIKAVNNVITAHTADTTIHVTSSDKTAWSGKQDALVSGTNIKTINNESILGSGNITISGGSGGNPTVELTQAEYDALVSAGTVSADTYYIITDAVEINANDYVSKAENNVSTTTIFGTYQGQFTDNDGLYNINYFILDYRGDRSATDVNCYIQGRDENFNYVAENVYLNYTNGTYTTDGGNYVIVEYDSQIEDFKVSFASNYSDYIFYNVQFLGNYIKVPFASIASGQSANVIETSIVNTLEDLYNKSLNSVEHVNFSYNEKSFGIVYYKNNGYNASDSIRLEDLKIVDGFLQTDIDIPIGISGWTNYDLTNNCQIGDGTGHDLYTTFRMSGNTSDMNCFGLQIAAGFDGNYNWDSLSWDGSEFEFTSNYFQGLVTITWDSNTSMLTIAYPQTFTYDGELRNTKLYYINSNNCSFGTDIYSVEYYGELTQPLAQYVQGKQDTLSAGTGIDITNDVISVSGTSAVTSGSTDVVTSGGVYDQLGGMKIVKLTESEYTALVTKDSDTLYVVIPDPSN